jgi:hypothetical protein
VSLFTLPTVEPPLHVCTLAALPLFQQAGSETDCLVGCCAAESRRPDSCAMKSHRRGPCKTHALQAWRNRLLQVIDRVSSTRPTGTATRGPSAMLAQLVYWHTSHGVRDPRIFRCVFVQFDHIRRSRIVVDTSALAKPKPQYKHLSCMQLGLTLLAATTAHQRSTTNIGSRSEISWLTHQHTDRQIRT